MEKYVIKRNGEYKPLDLFKIKDAILKGFQSVNEKFEEIIFDEVVLELNAKDTWSVEEIQDIIEKKLFSKKYFDVMRSFMLYRHTRKLQRESTGNIDSNTTYINSTQTIEEYIGQTDWRINANANTAYSNSGLVNNVAGKVIANYWLDKVYSPEEGATHRNGDVHIHDLDCLTGYCAGWSLRALLNDGFNGVRGRVESKDVTPHASTATLLLRNFFRQSTARTSPQKISMRLVSVACEELHLNYLFSDKSYWSNT